MVEQAHGGKDYRLIAGTDNKMFVKAELMPYRIKTTDMWMQHIQDISDEDCLKEGVVPCVIGGYCVIGPARLFGGRRFDTPREAFAALFDKVTRRGTFDSNPMVVAYKYELIRVF